MTDDRHSDDLPTDGSGPDTSATVSTDYDAVYFGDAGGGRLGGVPYTYEEPHWKVFFGGIADQLVALFEPSTFYDAGCAKGFLVRSMLERGVDARGGDISAHAIDGAPASLAERLEVKNLTEPFTDRYDLISCIEVLEHMSAGAARAAITNICGATDLVVFSSTPNDFDEPTHINVRSPGEWSQDFATCGFFRRTDIDASFVAPWAAVYERSKPTVGQLVRSYETLLTPLNLEVVAKRRALLEMQRDLTAARAPVDESIGEAVAQREELRRRLTADLEELRFQTDAERDTARIERESLLAERQRLLDRIDDLQASDLDAERRSRLAMADELIGARAELARVRIQAENSVVEAGRDAVRLRSLLAATEAELDTARSDVAAVRASTTWRIGRTMMIPVRVAREPLRLARAFAGRVRKLVRR